MEILPLGFVFKSYLLDSLTRKDNDVSYFYGHREHSD